MFEQMGVLTNKNFKVHRDAAGRIGCCQELSGLETQLEGLEWMSQLSSGEIQFK
jgi:hypothetical protein